MHKESSLIFYYPSDTGAPSSVGRSIFETLMKNRNKLPFNISIFSPSKSEGNLKRMFEDISIYTEKNIRQVPSGIVHIPLSPHLFPNSKFLLHIYAKIKKSNLVLNYHGDLRTEFVYNLRSNHTINYCYIPSYIFLPSLLRSSNQLIVHSYLFKGLVSEKYGVKNAKVIPNAIDDYWHKAEFELIPKKEEVLEIFYHGRLSAEKGVDLLIKGFYTFLLNKREKDAILYIAGEGPQKNRIEKLISDLDLSCNVVLLGTIDRATIKGYLKKVDVAIYPSLWDNFPLSYLEAFACANCPVYFSKKAGIYEFVQIDNKELYSFEPQVDVICNVIREVSRHEFDVKVIQEQKKFASMYKWDNIIKYYIDTYSQFIS